MCATSTCLPPVSFFPTSVFVHSRLSPRRGLPSGASAAASSSSAASARRTYDAGTTNKTRIYHVGLAPDCRSRTLSEACCCASASLPCVTSISSFIFARSGRGSTFLLCELPSFRFDSIRFDSIRFDSIRARLGPWIHWNLKTYTLPSSHLLRETERSPALPQTPSSLHE